jgi:acyl transferase domain-containing protein/aryl carrier-like protein
MSDFLNRISHYSAKRLALLSDELFSRVQELERAQNEPIAIVGIGCRFPGGARSPEQFWQLARAGVDAITEVPSDRWNADALYDPDPDAPGKMSTRWGGFIDRTDEFDPHFFGISPREAQSMDPQQRVVLEVTWEALEHAGISPQRLEGTRTSVYLGVSAADYYQLISAGGVAGLDAYTASGVAHSIASGRLSYFLGTRGPSMSIDTACSSSLVAIHHAVNSLRRGESSMALAGGVNLVLGPEVTIALSKSRMMAPDGRCKAFDSRADGFVRGEGCGILVLKRLRDAQADGDRIVAVIRGTAANHDGRSNGLTAPNGPSQEAVLREALANAGVQPHEVGFVEAHGTGTSLGDPIEVQALGAVLGAERAAGAPLLVGSVKANIGHLEAAAGVAGLIKLAMALKHGEIPAQIHIQKPNPHIAWDELAVRAPTSPTPWPSANGGRRIGGVSSFGFSGTNVHMVLEQAPEPPADTAAATAPERDTHVIALSARSEAALTTLAASYAKHLRASEDSLASLAFTLNAGRAHFANRAAFTARSKAAAIGVLERLAKGDMEGAAAGVARGRAPRIAFLFTGQGSQYAGMARALFESEPQFRATLERCDELLRPHFPRPLLSVLYPEPGDASPIDDTEYTQQALFCLEYALATLWMSWGVRPAMVLGHSVGEVAAACVAGVFSLEDALKLVASRGKLMGALPRNGGMVSVLATQAQVTEAIAPWRAEVAIAAVNGHDSIVISGLLSSLKLATDRLTAAGTKCTELNVSHAFHSPLMQPMLADFRRTLDSIAFSPPRIDLVSTVTGRPIGAEVASPAYWSDQVQAAVQFEPAVQSVAKAGCNVFLEVGPQPTLLGMARQCVSDDAIAWLPSLRRGKDDWAQMLGSLAALYAQGVDIDWLAFDFAHRRLRATLPGYPFERERFWVSAPAVAPPARAESSGPSPVPSRVRDMIHEIVWREARPAGMQLPSPQSIAHRTTPRLADLAAANSLDAYARFIPGLDALARAYVVRSLEVLGLGFAPGERFDVEALRKRLGILDKHRRLFARMLEMLAEDAVLTVEDGQWRVLREPPDVDADALCDELLARHADCSAELKLTRRCGESLASVLLGQADPLSLLFPESSLADAENLYQNSPPSRTYNGLIATILAECLAGAPFDRPLRILEIGAGTGSTTAYILEQLRDRAPAGIEYTFTDVSPLFLTRAAEKFGSPSYMQFRLLDIGRDPVAQGFEPRRFDIVVAANVLHATPDLDVTLGNVRALMRPGGLLVLLEGATPQRFGDLTVGLLEGWWAYSDTHRRNYALMQREPWLKLLRETGFVDAVAVPGEASGPVLSQQAVYIAQTPSQEARTSSRFVVVPDRQGFALAAAQALRAGGDTVDVVSAQNASSLAANLRTALAVPCDGVVFLPALDVDVPDAMPADTLLADQQNLLSAALAAVQTIGSGASNSARLWLVTRGAQAVGAGESANPAQATVWGFSHVVALERPELACTRVDLDVGASMHASVEALVAELRGPGLEDQIALRGERRLVRRLAHHEPRAQAAAAAPVSADKCHLVTGGLRGLGLRVAEWLADQGARHILLMGRSAPDALAQQTLERLAARGVKVVAVRGDIGSRKDVERVMETIAASGHRLGGIIHAAGVLDDGVLSSQSWPRFAAVMNAKVTGAWLLHTLARDLDFLVLFSSGASLAGSAGQANHAAANAFMDALAWYRQAEGLPAVSINWGPWADIGAAADRQIGATGLRPIEAVDGLAALGYAMCGQGAGPPFPSAQLAVFATNWSHLLEGRDPGRVAPLFAELAAEAARNSPKAGAEAARRPPAPSLRERMMAAAPSRRKTVLRDFVRQQTANVLGVQRAEDLDDDEPLRQLGLDSLMAVQLRNVLGKAVDRTLPATVTFDNPCLAALVEFLGAEVFAAELGELDRETPQSLAASDGGLEPMMEDELARQLAARLEGIASEARL